MIRTDRAPRDDLAARRAFRARVMAASAERHKQPRIARPKPPTGIVLAYTRTLVAMSRAMDAIIMSELRSAGAIRTDAAGDGAAPPDAFAMSPADIAKLTRVLKRKLGAVASRANLVGMIDKIASRTVAYSRAEWREVLKSSLGVDLSADPDLSQMVDKFRDRQTTLITSLTEDKIARVKTVLTDAGPNTRVEQIQQRIVEQTGATESRAALIARTETVTLNSQITQARHEAAGITEFEWSTSHDERVRDSHVELDGKRFAYANPPVVDGEPTIAGQTFNCRCSCLPILPGIDD